MNEIFALLFWFGTTIAVMAAIYFFGMGIKLWLYADPQQYERNRQKIKAGKRLTDRDITSLFRDKGSD